MIFDRDNRVLDFIYARTNSSLSWPSYLCDCHWQCLRFWPSRTKSACWTLSRSGGTQLILFPIQCNEMTFDVIGFNYVGQIKQVGKCHPANRKQNVAVIKKHWDHYWQISIWTRVWVNTGNPMWTNCCQLGASVHRLREDCGPLCTHCDQLRENISIVTQMCTTASQFRRSCAPQCDHTPPQLCHISSAIDYMGRHVVG